MTLLSIGDFSRMTHLSVKALRHYHDMGVLVPAAIDPFSGYRSYDTGQVPTAQVIRRLRDLNMPLDQIRAVLEASDVGERNQEIVAHLERMESQLAQTQAATVLATVRAGEVLPDSVLSLWKDGPAERIEIGALDDETIEQLLASALEGPVDAATVAKALGP